MTRRATVLFWGSTLAAVLFLGSIWAVTHDGRGGLGADLVLAVSSVGLVATSLVAGRIALVSARWERAHRRS